MSAPVDQNVLAILQGTLEADPVARLAAERNLKDLFQHPERFPIVEHIAIPSGWTASAPDEYAGGIALQKYIEVHWFALSPSFEPPVTPQNIRHAVRQVVFPGLGDEQEKIRMASAFAIALIAKSDFPDDWPELLNELIQLLENGSIQQVHGAMQVVCELVREDLSEDQLLPVSSQLLPTLLRVLQDSQHSPHTRGKAISVLEELVTMLDNVKEEHPEAVKGALKEIGPQWLSVFGYILTSFASSTNISSGADNFELPKAIFKCLAAFESFFPRILAPYRTKFVELAIFLLASLREVVTTTLLSPNDDIDDSFSEALENLISQILEYLEPVVRAVNIKNLFVTETEDGQTGTSSLQTMLLATIALTMVSNSQVEEWEEDPSTYIVDGDETFDANGLRSAGYDLIGSIIDMYPRPVTQVIWASTLDSVQRITAESSSSSDWWKSLEANLAVLEAVSSDIGGIYEEDQTAGLTPVVDLKQMFDQILPSIMLRSDAPVLQGRAFIVASCYALIIPPEMASQYLASAVGVLQGNGVSVLVKISAVKAIKNFCRHVDVAVMRPQSQAILTLLVPLLGQIQGGTLELVLETIRAVLALDKQVMTAESIQYLSETTWSIWLQHANDPIVTAIIEELFEVVAALPSATSVQALVRTVSPKLATAIDAPTSPDTVHLPGEAVQLANSLVRTRGGPLEQELVETVTAAVMRCLVGTEDMDVIQHGLIHLTQVVRKDCDKLIQWHNTDGVNGIAFIFHLLARFLQPHMSESAAVFVGELVMHLFRKAGSTMGSVLPDLLRAIVNRLQTAKLPSCIQSLILPFAYLFGTEYTQSTIDLLSSFTVNLADGSTKSALNHVLEAWCDTSDTITGSWNIRVSALGLAKLFAMPNSPLNQIAVKGDLIISDANRQTIMTRSRTKANPNTYTTISFPLKALKLILKDIQMFKLGEKGKVQAGVKTPAAELDIEDDDGDEEWADDDPWGDAGSDVPEFGYLSSWLDEGKGNGFDTQDDDEDLRQDPIAKIHLGDHLNNVLRHAYSTNENGMHEMVNGLNESERGILRGVLTI